jgi:hypothetical protein
VLVEFLSWFFDDFGQRNVLQFRTTAIPETDNSALNHKNKTSIYSAITPLTCLFYPKNRKTLK